MHANFKTIFSNKLEVLYQQLTQKLFAPGSAMTRRIVVVYGPAMKSWLMLKMAQDPAIGIATGIEFIYLPQAFEKIPLLFQPTPHQSIPSQLELSLAIELGIRQVLMDFSHLDSEEKRLWLPLIRYLKITPTFGTLRLTTKMEKRLTNLSIQLGKLFQDYGRFAGKVVSQWEKEKPHWQAILWNKLFNKETGWHHLYEALQQPFVTPVSCQIHFFSISFMSNCEFHYLQRAAEHVPIFHYMISPCAVFWSDIKSDREMKYLRHRLIGTFPRQIEELEAYLRDRNSLLANFGRLGREMVTQIEENGSDISAFYLLPSTAQALDENIFENEDLYFQTTPTPLSLLQAAQADMLLMRNPDDKKPFNIPHQDRSIQLHKAPNRRREVEILYHNLIGLIDQDPNLEPKDLIVMAPQILEYVPYIQSVFGSPESLLDYQILDLGMQIQSEIVQGFLQLIELNESRWDASHLLQLFAHPSFQRRHKLTVTDFQDIKDWIEEAGIHWGEDPSHRNEILKRRHCNLDMPDDALTGTWDHGLTRLMYGLTHLLKTAQEVSPCSSIEFSETELLGQWMQLLHALRDDLSLFHDGTHLTIADWVQYLNLLLDNYFQPDYSAAQQMEEYEDLKAQFEKLSVSSTAFKDAVYPFQTIKIHLRRLFQQRGITYRENYLQTVRFCSLIPLRSIPAKTVALLGMQEGSFPRPARPTSLNAISNHSDADYCPMQTDYDRYLFLEALHSAQDHLIISYVGYDQKDSKELQPSIVIEELFSYLNRCYTIEHKKISECCGYSHPFDSFDARYFSAKSALKNYSHKDFKSLQIHINHLKSEPNRFLQDFTLVEYPLKDIIPHQQVIDLKQLCEAARDPIKFHLNRTLDIYLKDEEDRNLKDEETFALSPLDRYLIKQAALKQPFPGVLQNADLEGKLSFGVFKQMAVKKLAADYNDMKANFNTEYIHEILFKIEFCGSCKEPEQLADGTWLLPPITIIFAEDHEIQVTGKIPHVSPQGIISLSDGGAEDIWKIWPQLLLFKYACQNYLHSIEPSVLFTKSHKTSPICIDNPLEYLKKYIRYYSLCLKNISPLTPDWHPFILAEQAEELQIKIKDLFSDYHEFHSEEARWVLNKDHLPDVKKMIAAWKHEAEYLVGNLIKDMTAKKSRIG